MASVCSILKRAFIAAGGGVAETPITDYSITANGATTSAPLKNIDRYFEDLILVLEVSSRTDGTYTAKLQHSPDGTNWLDAKALSTPLSANGVSIEAVDVPVFDCLRIVVTASSVTTGADVSAYIKASKKV